jgi:glucosamine--fructose-6-phosphate aminotransferase (isomerizing)
MPVVVIGTECDILDKVKSNIEEIKARRGRIIAVTTEGCSELDGLYEWKIEVPQIPEPLAPILTVIPLQLLAYHVARLRGCDVDKPRNLAKSVTVE